MFTLKILLFSQIDMQYTNLREAFLGGKPKIVEEKLRAWLMKQDGWMRSMIKSQGSSDPYWRHVSYVLSHYDGLWGGYQKAKGGNEVRILL